MQTKYFATQLRILRDVKISQNADDGRQLHRFLVRNLEYGNLIVSKFWQADLDLPRESLFSLISFKLISSNSIRDNENSVCI